MSLKNMKRRLAYHGGDIAQDRMIEDKLRSFRAATRYSYQGAFFKEWGPKEPSIHRGLFTPAALTENLDHKTISIEFDSNFKVGTYFEWENTHTKWIIFLQDKTELAYFRGRCAECNFTVKWVDKDQRLLETLISVIGPTAQQLRTSSSMQAAVAEDFPSASLKCLVQDNSENRKFFARYQIILLQGIAYEIEEIDTLSMPGVIQFSAMEYYVDKIENDVEENIRNAWNVQPILPEYPSDYAIEGPLTIKPSEQVEFSTFLSGGEWFILEAENLPKGRTYPAVLVGDKTQSKVNLVWDSMKSGQFTIGYRISPKKVFQRAVIVESLF